MKNDMEMKVDLNDVTARDEGGFVEFMRGSVTGAE